MHQDHLVARDVDQLVVLGLQRADVEEAVLGELVERQQPLAVGLLGLSHRRVVVAGLVVHVQLLDDGVGVLAVELVDRLGDVPLADLAVDEQRRVGVALAVEGRVQRPQAQLGLGDDHVARLDLVVEQIVELAHVEYRAGRRQLAVGDDVDAVGRGVDAVRAVGHGDVARVGRIFAVLLAAVEHRHAVDHLGLAGLDSLLDALDVEDGHPVLLGGRHLAQREALLRVVAGGERVLALVVGIDVVQVAIDHHLPGDLHGFAIDGGEEAPVRRLVVDVGAVVGRGDAVFTVDEDIAGFRILLHAQAVRAEGIGNLDDLVALHDVAAHARHARVGLVLHEQVTPVVGAVGERHVRVVQVAVEEDAAAFLQELARLRRQALGQDLAAFVGQTPTGGAIVVEHRHAHQLAHRGQAVDAQLARLAAGEEHVVLVEFARADVGALERRLQRRLAGRLRCLRRLRCRLAGRLCSGGRGLFALATPGEQTGGGRPGGNSDGLDAASENGAAARVVMLRSGFVLAHFATPWFLSVMALNQRRVMPNRAIRTSCGAPAWPPPRRSTSAWPRASRASGASGSSPGTCDHGGRAPGSAGSRCTRWG